MGADSTRHLAALHFPSFPQRRNFGRGLEDNLQGPLGVKKLNLFEWEINGIFKIYQWLSNEAKSRFESSVVRDADSQTLFGVEKTFSLDNISCSFYYVSCDSTMNLKILI